MLAGGRVCEDTADPGFKSTKVSVQGTDGPRFLGSPGQTAFIIRSVDDLLLCVFCLKTPDLMQPSSR